MADLAMLDIDSELFAQRLAELLVAKRRGTRCTRSAMARRSAGRFSASDLRTIESGRRALSPDVLAELTGLYEVDLAAILPERAPLAIVPGAISISGTSSSFTGTGPTPLLRAYLQLVRSLRNQKRAPIIVLRREDIDSLATYLGAGGEDVLDRLAALMGATRSQRTSMTALFSTGAVVIAIVGGSAAAHHAAGTDHATGSVRNGAAVVSIDHPTVAAGDAVTTTTPSTPVVAAATAADETPAPTSGAETIAVGGADAATATAATGAPAAEPAPATTPAAGTSSTATGHSTHTGHSASTSGSAPTGSGTSAADPTATTATDAPTTSSTVAGDAVTAPTDPPVVDAGTPPVPASTTPVVAVDSPPAPDRPSSTADQPSTTVPTDAGASNGADLTPATVSPQGATTTTLAG